MSPPVPGSANPATSYLLALKLDPSPILTRFHCKHEQMKSKKLCLLFLLLVMLLGVAWCEREPAGDAAESPPVLIIRNGTIFDGTGTDPITGGVVIKQVEHIINVGRGGSSFIRIDNWTERSCHVAYKVYSCMRANVGTV
jgi:hypothetical protein